MLLVKERYGGSSCGNCLIVLTETLVGDRLDRRGIGEKAAKTELRNGSIAGQGESALPNIAPVRQRSLQARLGLEEELYGSSKLSAER